jgi:hypothetical protein
MQLFPQKPAKHCPLQHSASALHASPIDLHVAPPSPHVAGRPVQRWLQQSALDAQLVPSARHGAVHTVVPPFLAQVPRQQSVSLVQIAPTSRQGPGPRSQRSPAVVHAPLQHVVPPGPLQSSPVGRQGAAGVALAQRCEP